MASRRPLWLPHDSLLTHDYNACFSKLLQGISSHSPGRAESPETEGTGEVLAVLGGLNAESSSAIW